MKKTKKLFTRTMATMMAATLLIGPVNLVSAHDTESNTVIADETDGVGRLEDIEIEGKTTPYFTYPDGTIYYSTKRSTGSLNKNSLESMTWGSVGGDKELKFQGWEDIRIPSSGETAAQKWTKLAKIIQLNSGLSNCTTENGLKNQYLSGYGGESTLNLVEEAMLKKFNRPEFKRAFSNETKKQFIVAVAEEYYGEGESDKEHAYVVAYLYNFRYTPMLTDSYLQWASENNVAGVEDNVEIKKEAGLGCYNDTPLTKTDSQHVETDVSQSSTKEENGSTEASFSVSSKVTLECGWGPLKVSSELGYTAGAAFSSGWSKSESTTYSNKTGSDQSVTLAPYSGVNLVTSKQSGTYKQMIDFPMAVSYDVKLVSYGMAKRGEPAKNPRTVVMATYEGRTGSKTRTDAQSDLYQRYFKNQEDQNVKYKGNAYPYDIDGVLSMCGRTVPFFTVTKTTFDGNVNDRISTASNFISLHPLHSVDTSKEMRDLSMKPGTTYQGRDIPVFGYLDKQYNDGNGNTAKYPTFNRDRGHWEIKAGSDIINITTDGQNRQRIKAVKEGEATIIYRIDENCYNSNEGRAVFATNDGLEATAEMTITVSKDAVENTGLINQALHALENDGTGWTVDDGYILGSEDGDALTDANIPMSGLEGIQLETKGNALDSRDGLQSVQYSLTGENAENYDVYYRSYVKDLGWMNWASNDQLSGTSGYDKEITAVQVMILEKDITPTADDSVTPAFFMENTNNYDPAVLFPLMKAAYEEYARPAISEITYSSESAVEDTESNESEATDGKATVNEVIGGEVTNNEAAESANTEINENSL